ncbi:MAG TPA: hypothetical protein VET48_10415 [Steroidobacteraceae bacterium]|nr:hypothetical protein [Steroidobacteraceae bacterium]
MTITKTAETKFRQPDALRRQLLKAAGALALTTGLENVFAQLANATTAKQIAGFEPQLVVDKATLKRWLQQLHDFGPIRATGTKQARAFEEWLATQFTNLGFALERDQFKLTSWECDLKDCSISIVESGKTHNIEVIAYYPFAASTVTTGPITGKILYAGVSEPDVKKFVAATDAATLANSIVVVDMPLAGGGVRGETHYYPDSFPAPFKDRVSSSPRPASQGGRAEMELLESKCRGIIFCYTDVIDEAARYNYLPFSDKHRKTPAIWVGQKSADYLRTISGKATATLRCDAKLTPNARADTLVATLKGTSDEVIFLTTQTDGPNECNENGGLGVLALATYYSKLPAAKRRRTLVCSLPTGHYAAGAVADPVTGSGRRAGTSGVMEKYPDVMKRTVAQIAMEQMGAMDWIEIDGQWKSSGLPAREMWIPTPAVAPTINKIFMASTRGEDPKYSRSALVESGYAPGEGGAPRRAGIPGLGLMGSPEYFFRCDPAGVLKYLSVDVMHNQVSIMAKMLTLMERLSPEQLKGAAPISDQDFFGG